MKSPFKLLDAYTLQDQDAFFGRDEEVDALYDLVFRSRLILIYGLSGTGKTSLIQCGLASRFDGPDWFPIFIRRQKDINTSLKSALTTMFGSNGPESLTEAARDIFDQFLRPIYLIFDQFEELFIFGSDAEIEEFVGHVRELYQSSDIPCRLLFVMREEYIGHLYQLEKEIPSLYDHRLRVEPMTVKKMKTVLQSSFDKFNITLPMAGDEGLQLIIDKISQGRSGIQLPYVQVYLDMLYKTDYERTYPHEQPTEEYPPLEFTRDEINAFGGIDDVLPIFLTSQVDRIQQLLGEQHAVQQGEVVSQVLDGFVSQDGTKRPLRFHTVDAQHIEVDAKDAQFLPKLESDVFATCLQELERSRLIRSDQEYYELAHDSLAELIEGHRTVEQRFRAEARQRILNGYLEYERSGEFLSRRQLDSFRDILDELHLSEKLKDFVDRSQQDAEQKERAAEQQRERELELTKARLETQRAAAKRQKVFLRWIALVAVLAIGASIWALNSRNDLQVASYQQEIEHINTLKGQGNFQLALEKLREARDKSYSRKRLAELNELDSLLTRIHGLVRLAEHHDTLSSASSLGSAEHGVRALSFYDQAFQIDQENRLLKLNRDRVAARIASQYRKLTSDARGLINFGECEQALQHLREAEALVPPRELAARIFGGQSTQRMEEISQQLARDIDRCLEQLE